MWTKQIHENFENIIQSSDSKSFLSNFVANSISQEQTSIDIATKVFTDFLINSAILANDQNSICFRGPKRSPKPNWKFKKRPKKFTKPKWHDATCENKLRKTCSLSKNSTENFIKVNIRNLSTTCFLSSTNCIHLTLEDT